MAARGRGHTTSAGELALPAGLTEAQRQAITAGDPVLCVLAGAGTGKTRVLTLRVARRVSDRSAAAEHTLVCTFSRKAAEELRSRLWHLEVDGVHAGTFHRTALGLLRQHRADHNLGPPRLLTDRVRVLAAILDDFPAGQSWTGRRQGAAGTVAAQIDTEIGWAKAHLLDPGSYPDAAEEHGRRPAAGIPVVAEWYRRYELERRRRRLLDFDDLLWSCGDLLDEDRQFTDATRWRFRHVFVDEMQDVNPAQFRLLRLLLGEEPDLFVVGDPNQSVYGWNGADPSLLERIPSLFPGARVVRLDQNHRCSPQVVAVASAVLGRNEGTPPPCSRPDGPVPRLAEHPTDAGEAAWVARAVARARRAGRRWSDIAVLARTNGQLDAVAGALGAERIPFGFAAGGFGPASDLPQARDRSTAPRTGGGPPARGGGRDWDDEPAADQVDDTDWDGREDSSESSGETGRGAYRDGGEASDDHLGASSGGGPDGVVLATFHRAKGLQWPVVFVVGVSEGLVPHRSARTSAARAEERRLLYVALTRAEEELTISWTGSGGGSRGVSGSDRGGRGSGDAGAASSSRSTRPRRPSPWIAPIAEVCGRLEEAAMPLLPAAVAARLAEIRANLPPRGGVEEQGDV